MKNIYNNVMKRKQGYTVRSVRERSYEMDYLTELH